MNTLIDPLKRIASDLVERRLWPVAVALLVAIVAVPVVLGGGGETASPAPAAPTAAESPASKSLITVADTAATTPPSSRAGKIEDPFYDPPAAPREPVAATSAPTPAAPADGGGVPAADPPPVETPVETPVEPAPTTTVTPAAEGDYYRTTVRWYSDDSGKARPVSRLTPLGGDIDTAALFLGVAKSSGTYAVFLLAPNATSTGEAACEDGTDCRVIGLERGQSQRVTVPSPDGGAARTYTLEVASVRSVETDAATARRMRARVHADGRDVMRRMWQDGPTAAALGPIGYDEDAGLLVKRASAAAAKASE